MMSYRPEIDGLRAMAVLSVVIFHAFPGLLPGGFVGVDIFFVISGYLITGLLRDEWESKGKIDIAAFYARRARRILPMLVTIVLCTAVAVAVLLDVAAAHETASSAAAALLFAANVYFQATTGGYFDSATDKLPLLHLWSLGVEEQFYMVWPLVLGLLLVKRGRVVRVVATLAGASMVFAAAMVLVDPNAAFYMMPTRFWELAAGGLIALSSAKATRGAAWVGLALIVVAIVLPTGGLAAVNVVLGTAGTALLIWAVHGRGALGAIGLALRSRPAVFIGLISYSLYLWHWPLLAIARAMHAGHTPAPLLAGLCAVAIVLSWLSYRFIETPFRRPNPKTPNRQLVTASLLACVSLSSISWAVAREVQPTQSTVQANPLIAFVKNDLPPDQRKCRFNIRDSLDVVPKPACERSSPGRAVIVWGDSHAWSMGPFAAELAAHDNVQWLGLTRDSCPPTVGFDVNKIRPLESEKCRRFNELAVRQITKADTVIMVGSWLSYENRDELLQATAKAVELASRSANQVLLMGPSPILRDTVPRCIAADNMAACEVSRADFDAESASVTAALQAIAKKARNVTYVSRASFFCNDSTCPAMREGVGLYWDSNHASATAAKAFAAQYLAHHPILP